MARVLVRELIAWDLDADGNRPIPADTLESQAWQAQKVVWRRAPHLPSSSILPEETASQASLLESRIPLIRESGEFDGLRWRLAIVDLRKLLAFQRRLCFDLPLPASSLKISSTWEDLLEFALPGKSANESPSVVNLSETEIEVRSGNPNFRLIFAAPQKQELNGFSIKSSYGSPYMEVAQYRDRWFLRDGYHRAYTLLKAGIFAVPAVVIHAETLEELGAVQPWFFSEETLFSDYPPRLEDYWNDKLVIEYERPAREKVIRISLRESYEMCQEDMQPTR